MILLKLIGNDYKYEIENIIQLFFPEQSVSTLSGNFALIEVEQSSTKLLVSVTKNEHIIKLEHKLTKNNEMTLCRMLFEILTKITNLRPQWGIQTGVRPVKLFRNLTKQNSLEFARDYFLNEMKVSPKKIELAKNTMINQEKLLERIKPNSFSLYISIPFCKSRCSYCSFISHDVSKSVKLIPHYIKLLCEEIKQTAIIANQLNLKLQSVYFGGGTPTAIKEEELAILLDCVNSNFDTKDLLEYTVEAGRVDTITKEKLQVIKLAGVNRISINPQSLNDNVLKAIKREHTVKDFYDTYYLARDMGFENINTDLIAGLPEETFDSFCNSINQIIELNPTNVTVHTLSIKRSSSLVYKGQASYDSSGESVSKMLGYSENALANNNYLPYYMYRQSKMAGNNENIGWSKQGFESFYNVFIMEELQTILAVGAGASTKLVKNNEIKRIFNYKYPYEYINNFEEMQRRKNSVLEFMS